MCARHTDAGGRDRWPSDPSSDAVSSGSSCERGDMSAVLVEARQLLVDASMCTEISFDKTDLTLSPVNRVVWMAAGSVAERAGLRVLDVITEVDGRRVTSAKQTRAVLNTDPVHRSSRRCISVLRPALPDSQGAIAPSLEVFDILKHHFRHKRTAEAWGEFAQQSERVWQQAHVSRRLWPFDGSTAPDENDCAQEGCKDLLHRELDVLTQGSVAHSELEYLPVTRGAAAGVAGTVVAAGYILFFSLGALVALYE
uniref:PDZ domain-containing protein n=1 Tax=Coccolithus braarudii TaxID=221442 RepID=A0A7S0Q593_9EUKA